MRLYDDIRKVVVFLGFRSTDAKGNPALRFGGTGFFVAHPIDPSVPNSLASYLVTARHVAENMAGPFAVGMIDAHGVSDTLDIDVAHWTYHPDPNVDVAVVDLARNDNAWLVFPTFGFADNNGTAVSSTFGVGDLVYIVGLYRLFPGGAKISPIVHTGHVAMTPDEDIPARNRQTDEIVGTRGYLIEAQTLEGLSGSPVFLRRTNITGISSGAGKVVAYSDDVYLLGLWQGAWDGIAGDVLSERVGSNMRVPVGMGITIPSRRILETLQQPNLEKERAQRFKKAQEEKAATMD